MRVSRAAQKRSLRYYCFLYAVVLVTSVIAIAEYAAGVFRHQFVLYAPAVNADKVVGEVFFRVVLLELLVLLIFVLIAFLLYRRVVPPLAELCRGAERFARGNFQERLPHYQVEEIDALAGAMNRMGAQLDRTIAELREQRSRQEAVLASMIEGVVLLDLAGRIVSLNEAARSILCLDAQPKEGHELNELVDNIELRQLLRRAEAGNVDFTYGEIVFAGHETKVVEVRVQKVLDEGKGIMGILVVLSDITERRKFEQVRRDFVANVSHELKTPVTSIKGFVETLLEGALNNREVLENFLNIISNQANRLTAIIEDLLTLARLEGARVEDLVVFREEFIADIASAAVDVCRGAAKEKKIDLACECDQAIKAKVDRSLLEQALVNLIDNAIKYSNPGSEVRVRAWEKRGEVVLYVSDNGPGIEPAHIARIFERFYRIDKARSRKIGGTGLGLAIVKHIASLHQGKVEVISEVGKGSTFSLSFPKSRVLRENTIKTKA